MPPSGIKMIGDLLDSLWRAVTYILLAPIVLEVTTKALRDEGEA